MSKSQILSIGGTALAVVALAAWFIAAPAAGSGWILFVAFIGSWNLMNAIKEPVSSFISGLIITIAAALAWYFHQGYEHVWWVGFLAVIAGLGTFTSLLNALKNAKD